MTQNSLKNLCILVKVESGIPVFLEIFHERKKAKIREKNLRKEMNPDNDETAIFEIDARDFILKEFERDVTEI